MFIQPPEAINLRLHWFYFSLWINIVSNVKQSQGSHLLKCCDMMGLAFKSCDSVSAFLNSTDSFYNDLLTSHGSEYRAASQG